MEKQKEHEKAKEKTDGDDKDEKEVKDKSVNGKLGKCHLTYIIVVLAVTKCFKHDVSYVIIHDINKKLSFRCHQSLIMWLHFML